MEVVIDPGQAFGTGAHATTRLCLQLLLELVLRGPARRALLDVGCGSGVLAIVAAKLGYAPVIAFDNDPLSVQATRENATANGVELDVLEADLRAGALPLTAVSAPAAGEVRRRSWSPTCCGAAARARRGARPGTAALIASGLLEGEGEEVAQAFGPALGMRVRQQGGVRRVGGPVARGTGRDRPRGDGAFRGELARNGGGGEHVGAVHEVDRRPYAVVAAEQLVGRRQREPIVSSSSPTSAGFGVTAGGDRHVQHRPRLLTGPGEQRRSHQARVSVHARETP